MSMRRCRSTCSFAVVFATVVDLTLSLHLCMLASWTRELHIVPHAVRQLNTGSQAITYDIFVFNRPNDGHHSARSQGFLAEQSECMAFLSRSRCQVVIGPAWSSVSVAVSGMASLLGLPMISYSATSPLLSEGPNINSIDLKLSNGKYPFFARIVPDDNLQANLMVDLLFRLGYQSINVVYSSEAYGEGLHVALHEQLAVVGSRLEVSAGIKQGSTADSVAVKAAISDLRMSRTRVVVVAAIPSVAETFLRVASDEGLVAAGWAWFCSESSLPLFGKVDFPPIAGIIIPFMAYDSSRVAEGYDDAFHASLLGSDSQCARNVYHPDYTSERVVDSSPWAPFVYDAIGVAASAAQRVSDPNDGYAMMRAILETELSDGATGKVSFSSSGGRRQIGFSIYNSMNDGSVRLIGNWSQSAGLVLEISAVVWPGGLSGSAAQPKQWNKDFKEIAGRRSRRSAVHLRMLFDPSSSDHILPVNKEWMPCMEVRRVDCKGGYAMVDTWFKHWAQGHDNIVTIVGFKTVGRLAQFHPLGKSVITLFHRRLGVDFSAATSSSVIFSKNKELLYQFWTGTSAPLVVSDIDVSIHDSSDLFGLPRYFVRELNGTTVGFLTLRGSRSPAKTLPHAKIIPSVTQCLRKLHGASVIVAILHHFKSPTEEEGLKSFDIDAVIMGSEYLDKDLQKHNVDATPYKLNDTWMVPLPSSTGWISHVDLQAELDGVPSVTRKSVKITRPLPSELQGTQDYFDAAQWLQNLVNDAQSDPTAVGNSTSSMPAGLKKYGNGTTVAPCQHRVCAGGVLVTEALLKALPEDTDVVILNGGMVRGGWDEGPIYWTEIFDAYPYDGTTCRLRMTGPQLWATLEHGIGMITSQGERDQTKISGAFPQIAGIRVTVNPSNQPARRIIEMLVMNKKSGKFEPLSRRRNYTVGTSSFICSGGDKYPYVQQEFPEVPTYDLDTAELSDISLHQIVRDYLGTGTFSPATDSRMQYVNHVIEPLYFKPLQATDCSTFERHLPEFEDCEPCPEGEHHPRPGAHECEIPESWSSLVVTLSITFVCILIVVILVSYNFKSWVRRRPQLWLPYNHPAWAAISLEQLKELREEVRLELGEQYETATMYDVVNKVIKPLCKESNKCYARQKNPGRSAKFIHVFVSHAWAEHFDEFVEHVLLAFEENVGNTNFWICALALYQSDDLTKVAEQVAPKRGVLSRMCCSDSENPSNAPFTKALTWSQKILVVQNRQRDLYTRAWCVWELYLAKKNGIIKTKGDQVVGHTLHVTGIDASAQKEDMKWDPNRPVDINHCESSDPKDKERILKHIGTKGAQQVNRIVTLIRRHRVRSKVSQVVPIEVMGMKFSE